MVKLMVLVLIRSCNAPYGLALVIASAGLLFPSIHLISMISLCLYDCLRYITLTIKRFSWVFPSFTKQLYRDFESVQMIIGSGSSGKVEADKSEIEVDELSKVEMEAELDEVMIFSTVDLMIDPASKPCAIAYNSEAKMLLVTRLHFVDDQWMIFALLNWSAR